MKRHVALTVCFILLSSLFGLFSLNILAQRNYIDKGSEQKAAQLPFVDERRVVYNVASRSQLSYEKRLTLYFRLAYDDEKDLVAAKSMHNLATMILVRIISGYESADSIEVVIELYKSALRIDPELSHAKYNLELLYRFLESMEVSNPTDGERPGPGDEPDDQFVDDSSIKGNPGSSGEGI